MVRKISIEEVIYRYPKPDGGSTRRAKSFTEAPHCKGLRWWAAGAVLGLVGAFVFPLISEIAVHYFSKLSASTFLHKLSTISTMSVIPVLTLGFFCLVQAVKRSTPEPEGCSERQLAYTAKPHRHAHAMLLAVLIVLFVRVQVAAQIPTTKTPTSEMRVASSATLIPSEKELLLIDRIEKLERRLAELEAQVKGNAVAANTTTAAPAANQSSMSVEKIESPPAADETDRSVLDSLRDTTVNVTFDGYYGYNFNRPVGGVNLLRAYDVMSNSFSLNQAAVVIEKRTESGKRKAIWTPIRSSVRASY